MEEDMEGKTSLVKVVLFVVLIVLLLLSFDVPANDIFPTAIFAYLMISSVMRYWTRHKGREDELGLPPPPDKLEYTGDYKREHEMTDEEIDRKLFSSDEKESASYEGWSLSKNKKEKKPRKKWGFKKE
ncbi:MAG: hypothetical protein ACXQTP_01480 [Candidatus Methanofastidiosia archaeon]